MRTVVAFGTFDVVHLGHIAYLRAARSHGDHLIVVVSRDSTVRTLKGHRPHFTEKERVRFLRELKLIDRVVLGNAGDHMDILFEIRPDVIMLGHDHAIRIHALKKHLSDRGMNPIPRILRASPYQRSRYTSHELKKLI